MSALKTRRDGTQAYHSLVGNDAQLVFWNDLYRVYRDGKGLYAEQVFVSRNEQTALDYIRDNGLTLIR